MKKIFNIIISIIISSFFFMTFKEGGFGFFSSLIMTYTCASGSFLGASLAELLAKFAKPDFIFYRGAGDYLRTKLYFFIGINIIGGVLGVIFLGLYGIGILFRIFGSTFFGIIILIIYSAILNIFSNYCHNYANNLENN